MIIIFFIFIIIPKGDVFYVLPYFLYARLETEICFVNHEFDFEANVIENRTEVDMKGLFSNSFFEMCSLTLSVQAKMEEK